MFLFEYILRWNWRQTDTDVIVFLIYKIFILFSFFLFNFEWNKTLCVFLKDFVGFIHIYPCFCVNIVTVCACSYTTKTFELVQHAHMVWNGCVSICVCKQLSCTMCQCDGILWRCVSVWRWEVIPGLPDVDVPSCSSTDGNSRISTIRATADNLIQQKNNSEKEWGYMWTKLHWFQAL